MRPSAFVLIVCLCAAACPAGADTWPVLGKRIMATTAPTSYAPDEGSARLVQGSPGQAIVIAETPQCVSVCFSPQSGIARVVVGSDGTIIAPEQVMACIAGTRDVDCGTPPQWHQAVSDLHSGAFVWMTLSEYHNEGDQGYVVDQAGTPVLVSRCYCGATMSPADPEGVFALGIDPAGGLTGNVTLSRIATGGSLVSRLTIAPYTPYFALGTDGSGNAVVAWSPVGQDSSWIQVFDDGTGRWSGTGVQLPHVVSQVVADGTGGVYVLSYASSMTWCTHLTSTGAPAPGWSFEGMLLDVGDCHARSLLADGQGGVFVTYACSSSFLTRRLLPSGAVAAGWGAQTFPNSVVIADGFGGAYAAWAEDAPVGIGRDISYAHVLSDGSTGAGSSQTLDIPEDQKYPALLSDGAGGAFLAWTDDRDPTETAIYATHIAAETSTPVTMALVRTASHDGAIDLTWFVSDLSFHGSVWRSEAGHEWTPAATVTGDGSGLVSYHDTAIVAGRTYCYRLVDGGHALRRSEAGCALAEGIPGVRLSIAPAPARGHLDVSFTAREGQTVVLRVLDATGRIVAQERIVPGVTGPQRVVLELPQHRPASVYFVEMQQGQRRESIRTPVVP